VTTTNVFGQQVSGTVSGTGFIITSDGYILTNNHVIAEAYNGGHDITVILSDGTTYKAEIVGFEDDNDIAVLKIDAKGLDAVTIGDSDKMEVGEDIYAVGNPLGELTYTITSGIVSALGRSITGNDGTNINMFQIDAAVNSGNSGGPVYNSSGEVIGVVTAKYSQAGVEGLGFAVPINDAAEIATELMENGYVTGKAYMGVSVTTVSEQMAEYYGWVVGAYVRSVDSGSCAEKAGLKAGDIITKLGDTETVTAADLIAAKKEYKAGDTAELTVYRSGEYEKLSIYLRQETPKAPESEEPEAEDSASPQPGQKDEFNGGGRFSWPLETGRSVIKIAVNKTSREILRLVFYVCEPYLASP
jgi:serine protease Do